MHFHQCPHQPCTSRDSGDPTEAVRRDLSPLSTRPWDSQAHEGGISAHTEWSAGQWVWEGLHLEFQILQLSENCAGSMLQAGRMLAGTRRCLGPALIPVTHPHCAVPLQGSVSSLH